MPKMFELIGDMIAKRDAALAVSDGEKRRDAAVAVVQDGLFILRQILGDDIIKQALGTVSEENRQDVIWNAGSRINMLASLLHTLPQDAASPFRVANEAMAIYKGDAPLLFARLTNRKRNHRINAAKFEAFIWNAYLKGRGMSATERQNLIASAFKQTNGWETIRRGWKRDVKGTLSEATAKYLLLQAEIEGRRGLPRWKMQGSEDWQAALAADGLRFLRALKSNKGNR